MSLFTSLRAGEGRGALLLCGQAFCIMFAYYLLKVIRDPLILAEGDPELKAYTNAAQAVILMFIVPVFARAYHHLGSRAEKHVLIRHLMLFFISNLVLFGLAYMSGWRIGIAFYVWLGIFAVMVLAVFWAFSADLYNIRSGQRIFPVIAAAASAGAFLGARVAGVWDPVVGHHGVIFSAALVLLLPWWLCAQVDPTIPAGSKSLIKDEFHEQPPPVSEGFMVVFRSYYLTMIAFFVIVMNLINTNGEYILSIFVTQAADSLFTAGQDIGRDSFITSFYSSYYSWFTLLGFLVQLFLVARIFEKIGLRGAILILPAIMILSYSVMLLFPLLAVVRYAMIAENSVGYSLQNTTRHVLFLPVSREEKYVGKHCIDTFFFRFGDVLSAAAVFIGSGLLGIGLSGFVGTNIALAVFLFWLSWIIGRRNQAVIEANYGNLPPQVAIPLPDLDIPAGEISQFALNEDTFIDPDEGDALKYLAFSYPQEKLPNWARFDGHRREFSFRPPAGGSGVVEIRVVARDYNGLEAETCFRVSFSSKEKDMS